MTRRVFGLGSVWAAARPTIARNEAVVTISEVVVFIAPDNLASPSSNATSGFIVAQQGPSFRLPAPSVRVWYIQAGDGTAVFDTRSNEGGNAPFERGKGT